MSKRYSVIIPVYNIEDYLHQCIDSILNQSYSSLEIILVDDGSTDRCPQICDDYAKLDDRIKVLHQKNNGQSSARNAGISASTGDYLFFLDGDDYLIDDVFTSTDSIIAKQNVDIIFHNYKILNSSTGELTNSSIDYSELQNSKYSSTEGMIKLLQINPLFDWFPWQFIIKRDIIFENHLFFEEGVLYEDVKLVFKLILNSITISFNNCQVLIYRIKRNGATTSIKKLKPELDRINAACQSIDWINNHLKNEYLSIRLNNNFACMIFTSIINLNYLPINERKYLLDKVKKEYNRTKYIKSKKQRYSKILCDILGIRMTAKILYIRSLLKFGGE
ncbi:glycosyltransferase family 2 protein [Paenibacillus sp. URB8-2]|uniref:glycosyltransferase family 2 protein n=1 Tax=Paenibacillus sp. URB8-2 TaxID=2741301 RepID=UPI0015BD147D|nr:glycosyltransferase [Paenibacillus sp. URB8-2]BCG60549.1 glycosyl transferase [Paenibacillus sp. URB8-2]